MDEKENKPNVELFKKLINDASLVRKYIRNEITLEELKKHDIKLVLPLNIKE